MLNIINACAELNALIMLNYYIIRIIIHIVLLIFAPFGGILTHLDPVHTGPDPYGHHINLKSKDEHDS